MVSTDFEYNPLDFRETDVNSLDTSLPAVSVRGSSRQNLAKTKCLLLLERYTSGPSALSR